MNKRILATLCVTIFVLSAIATVNQVSAHYTLGAQLPGTLGEVNAGGLPVQPTSGAGNGQPRYHIPENGWDMANRDWAGHVPGHIAFVRPGTLYVPPSDQFNYYSPDGAVLTDTVGDLFVYICVADQIEFTFSDRQVWTGQDGPINISWRGEQENFLTRGPFSLFEPRKHIYIAIPPEFTPPVDWEAGWGDVQTTNQGFGDTSNIETTITNDHQFIETGKFGSRHPVAPNWWFIRITSDPTYHPAAPEIRDNTGAVVPNPLYSVNEVDILNTHFKDTTGVDFNFKYVDDPVYAGSAGFLYPPGMDPWLDRQISPANTNGDESEFAGCYRVKILNMKAPNCAGKYFFKTFATGSLQPYFDFQLLAVDTTPDSWAITGQPTGGIPDRWQAPGSPTPAAGQTGYGGEDYNFDPWSGYLNGYFEKFDSFWPENYPVLLVKGEIDPGYISGTVRYCGHSQYYYGQFYGEGVHTSGKVVAEGTALDPITNEPTGRPVCAVGWFLGELPGQEDDWKDRNTGSQGFYEIEGVAAGVYTLTAHAAGFVPRTLATQITIKRGQSLNGIDIYVCPTAKLQTKVYSKCPTGPVDWPEYVTLDGFPTRLQTLPVVPGGADVRGTGVLGPDGLGPADGIWYWFTEGAQSVQMKNIWADMMSRGLQDLTALDLYLDLNNNYVTDAQMDNLEGRYGWAWQELVDANGSIVAWQDYTFDIAQDARTFGTFLGRSRSNIPCRLHLRNYTWKLQSKNLGLWIRPDQRIRCRLPSSRIPGNSLY
ncbi:MAG: carboxypeptidase-like regulatory domain-containing protein [Candidatus Thorarchaeota archaeon]